MSVQRSNPRKESPTNANGVLRDNPRLSFDPRNMQTPLAVWVRADLSTTMNGSTVSGWADMSGNGRDFAQATASSQPSLTSGGLGGRAELTFDGSSDVLDGSSLYGMLSADDEWTVALIVRGWTWGAAINATWGTAYARGAMGAPSGGGGYFGLVAGDSSNGLCSGYYDGTTPAEVGFPPSAGAQGADSVWVTVCDGANLTCRINGSAGATDTDGGGLHSNATTLGLGQGSSSGTFWDGAISEAMIFDGALSSDDISSLESYLSNRYNITMAAAPEPSGADDFVAKCQDSSDLYALWTCQDQATGDLDDADTAMTDQTGGSVPDISVHLASAGNWQIEDSSPPDASLDSLSKYVSTDAGDLGTSNFASVDSAISPIASETDSSSGFTVLYMPSEYITSANRGKLEIACYDGSGSTPTAVAGAFFIGAKGDNFPSSFAYLHGGRMASDTGFSVGSSGNSGTDSWRSGAWCFFGWRLVSDGAGGFTAYCYVQQLGSAWGTDQTSWSQGQTAFSTLKDGLRFGYNSSSEPGSAGTAWAAHGLFSDDIGVGASGTTLRTIFETIS
jgi:hypothetical protein